MSSDTFWGCDIETLLRWILEEEKQGQILGIAKALFLFPNPRILSECIAMGNY